MGGLPMEQRAVNLTEMWPASWVPRLLEQAVQSPEAPESAWPQSMGPAVGFPVLGISECARVQGPINWGPLGGPGGSGFALLSLPDL